MAAPDDGDQLPFPDSFDGLHTRLRKYTFGERTYRRGPVAVCLAMSPGEEDLAVKYTCIEDKEDEEVHRLKAVGERLADPEWNRSQYLASFVTQGTDGRHYLATVMQFADHSLAVAMGPDADSLSTRMTPLQFIYALCMEVHDMHQHGIAGLGLKAENVMLRRVEAAGGERVRLMLIGLASAHIVSRDEDVPSAHIAGDLVALGNLIDWYVQQRIAEISADEREALLSIIDMLRSGCCSLEKDILKNNCVFGPDCHWNWQLTEPCAK